MDLKEFHEHGQSIWLDYIRRDLLESGEFARMARGSLVLGIRRPQIRTNGRRFRDRPKSGRGFHRPNSKKMGRRA